MAQPMLGDGEGVTPDEAFTVLGNETRIAILRTLGDADSPVSFTELRERVGLRQGANFNYHLDKIVGHFVGKTSDGYVLRQPGRRVVEAVISGAVTEDAVIELTRIDDTCWLCGGQLAVSFDQEHLDLYCMACDGFYGDKGMRRPLSVSTDAVETPRDCGYLGVLTLPPAGLTNRTPEEVYRAAMAWGILEVMAISNDICPRCAGSIDITKTVCEQHDVDGMLCCECGNSQAIHIKVDCRTCIYQFQGMISHVLMGEQPFLDFMTSHGASPFAVEDGVHPYSITNPTREKIQSVDPFSAEITYTIGDETVTLTVDDDFSVVGSTG